MNTQQLKAIRAIADAIVDSVKVSGAHTFYSVAGRDYLVRDDLVRNSF